MVPARTPALPQQWAEEKTEQRGAQQLYGASKSNLTVEAMSTH